MANRAYLYNTPYLTNDAGELWRRREEPGGGYVTVAEASYRLPIAWPCCFRPQDMRPVQVAVDTAEGEGTLELRAPATTVEQAIANFEAALPLLEAIAGDAKIARAYWEETLAELRALPLPYLTMDGNEVVLMGEPEEMLGPMAQAMAGDASAIDALKELAGYEGGPPPYGPDVFMGVIAGPNQDKRRNDNAVVFQGGFYGPDAWYWHQADGVPEPAARERPAMAGPNLVALHEALRKRVRAIDADANCYFGFAPKSAQGEVLKFLITTDTDARRDVLQADAGIKGALDGEWRAQVETVCRGHGFVYAGHVLGSDETRRRDHGGDYNYWVKAADDAGAGVAGASNSAATGAAGQSAASSAARSGVPAGAAKPGASAPSPRATRFIAVAIIVVLVVLYFVFRGHA